MRKNDTFKKAPLPDSELDDQVKGAKAKLQAALKTYDWPCDDRFVKQFKEGTE